MNSARVLVSAVSLVTLITTSAVAMPFTAPASNPDNMLLPVRYGYGPLRYGLYGKRRASRGLPNGTGYRGRGSRTGGPAGGLPGRS